ncbi:MAG: aminotransferase class I/II-fold pyridoxal phosphate-dependent enzyme [candidate division WOR-3 bacterium]|nr:MAG: aminotransferase class I/II-fold pyridoxal phosphate-dependent enzyme [candidate division WOR-3 bacterium]
MKPFQVHLFSEEGRIPESVPPEPSFVYGNKRYLNFLHLDCLHMKNSEHLRETARMNIEARGIVPTDARADIMANLQGVMNEVKRLESLLFFPDEISMMFALVSIFGPKTTFFADYESSSSLLNVLQYRNIEYYDFRDLDQLRRLLGAHAEKVMFVDGIYDWLGNISPANELVKIAHENECVVIANELSSFGLLGREGRGFVDLCNAYEDINIDIGSFSKYLGGFGCYLGSKKYMVNKIRENVGHITDFAPQFMLAVNLAGLEMIKETGRNKELYNRIWKNSRYFITNLKQMGFKTVSETPLTVVIFNNNEEAGEFTKKLIDEQIIAAQKKERIRLCLSVEHSKEDLDFCLHKFEIIGNALGIIKT